MTISKITIGNKKSPQIAYQAMQRKGETIYWSLAMTRIEAINDLLKALTTNHHANN